MILHLVSHYRCDPTSRDRQVRRTSIQEAIHVASALLSCYLGKGAHDTYDVVKAILYNDPDRAVSLMDVDWLTNQTFQSGEPMYPQEYCTRILCKSLI